MQTGRTCDRGFSILEILLVVGILATLVGLAMPSYQDYLENSRRAVLEANFRAIRKAVMEYHADTGLYPADANELKTRLGPKYLMDSPADPDPAAPATWGYHLDSGLPAWDAKYAPLIQ